MKEAVKLVFQCDFCDKRMFRRSAMIIHELWCSCNPLNKDACLNCSFCQEIEKTIYFDTWDGEGSRIVKSFKCTKLDKLLYPHKAVRIEMNYPESFENEEVMPNECEHFEFTF